MPSIVTLSNLAYAAPDGRRLFDHLDLSFAGERTGVVGRNGAGKTTLVRLILGELAPAAGSISVAGRLGVLRQAVQPPPGATAADLMGVSGEFARLRRLAEGEGSEEDLALADWTLEARLEAALADVGLAGLDLDRPAAALSGGEATRAALAGLVAAEPDLLLLDEPTNNLDAEARSLIAQVIGAWRGGAIIVSHDRALLRRMDRILELSSLGPRLYGGGWDLYAEREAEARAAAARDLDGAKRELARVEREAQAAREKKARRDAAGRRFAARGSEPKILLGAQAERAENSGGREGRLAERQRAEAADHLAEAEARVERLRSLAFELPSTGLPAGRVVLEAHGLTLAVGGRTLLEGFDLKIAGPERLAITGPNGAGKTSLLRVLAGEAAPDAGEVRRTGRLAMLDQRTSLLSEAETVLENFRRLNPQDSDNASRAALARFLFRNEAALKPAASLSGGERLRAALACVVGGTATPELLILDEPTNHLDIDSVEAVEAALRGYDGALLVVSHDEDFLEAIGIERRIAL